jgi:hypothetical protein
VGVATSQIRRLSIQRKLPMVKIGESDKPIWVILKKKKKSCYNSVKTWDAIRSKKPKVYW